MNKVAIFLVTSVASVVAMGDEVMDVPHLLEHCTTHLDLNQAKFSR